MKIIAFILSCISITGCSSIQHNKFIPEYGSLAILKCQSEYEEIAGKKIPEQIDRAYVFSNEKSLGVLMSHGEPGIFGERSSDYLFYVACGLRINGAIELVHMQDGLKTIYSSEPQMDKTDYSGYGGQEHMYLLVEDRFVYEKSQKFSLEE